MAMLLAPAGQAADLNDKVWNRGAADCSANRDPWIEVFQLDAATYVLRQNKCVHFEAPFIYVLFGDHTVFVQDTGATVEAAQFPLYDTVQKLIAQRARPPGAAPLRIPRHSFPQPRRSHGRRSAVQGGAGVTLVEPDAEPAPCRWAPSSSRKRPRDRRRSISVRASSSSCRRRGHQDQSLAVYDAQTGWLLTGDSIYPGLLYIKDWNTSRSSIHRLAAFAKAQRVSAVMGTHIEMSRTPGKVYPRGSTFQPDETGLALTAEDLFALDQALQRAAPSRAQ